jgi:hypothetical protein
MADVNIPTLGKKQKSEEFGILKTIKEKRREQGP